VITKAGRAALWTGGEKTKPAGKSRGAKAAPDSVRPNSKQARLLALLRRSEGAAMADLTATTGWQAHSVRAALTGFRKRGIPVTRAKDEAGTTVYRVAEA
jgi:hypothetical protein